MGFFFHAVMFAATCIFKTFFLFLVGHDLLEYGQYFILIDVGKYYLNCTVMIKNTCIYVYRLFVNAIHCRFHILYQILYMHK